MIKPLLIFSVVILPSLISAQNIIGFRISNARREDIIVYTKQPGVQEVPFEFIENGRYIEHYLPAGFEASVYAYPATCLNVTKTCDYPTTKVNIRYSDSLFGEEYLATYAVDISEGFNYPASVGSYYDDVIGEAKCLENLLQVCPQEDQITDEDGNLVSCKTSETSTGIFKEQCPAAIVQPDDVFILNYLNYNWEITFYN